jgi:ribosomal protein S8
MAKTGRVRQPTLVEILDELGYIQEWTTQGETRGRIETAIAYINDGDTIEHAAKMAGISVEELEQYL